MRSLPVWILSMVVAAPSAAAEPSRFEALLADGTRHQADRLRDWHQNDVQPKVGDQPLFDPARPMLWLRDHGLPPGGPPRAMVETIGGDRLPGMVLAFRAAGVWEGQSLGDHFLVRPDVPVRRVDDSVVRHVAVLARFVRRIVWERASGVDHYQPGTAFYRDGRVVTFRAARFADQEVRLLLDDGLGTVAFADLAEIHLPWRDPWEAYYDELGAIDSKLESRLIQIETTGGLLVTGSLSRFRCGHHGDAGNSDDWWHGVQPAWCPELLWAPGRDTWMRRSFAPQAVPLSRIPPRKAVVGGMLVPSGWPWRVNLGSQGGTLRGGGQEFGWGFGVHARAELHFPLPPFVRTFRTRVGLDETAGAGGCARAKALASWRMSQPLYQSPLLIGSSESHDTGALALDVSRVAEPSLVLLADPAHQERPAGADPFEIRDMVDWLDPVVELDPESLRAEVAARLPQSVPAWQGWKLAAHSGPPRFDNRWDNDWPPRGRFHTTAQAVEKPFVLRRAISVGPSNRWLSASAFIYHDFSDRPLLRFYADGRLIDEKKIPVRDGGNRDLTGAVFSLLPYVGRTIEVELEQTPGDERLGAWWNAVGPTPHLPTLRTVFEEEGNWEALDDAKGEVVLVEEAYTGRKAARIPGGGGRYRLGPFDPPISVRQSPGSGEYRYLRLAFRRVGKGSVLLEFEHPRSEESPVGLLIGRGSSPPERSGKPFPRLKRELQAELSEEWLTLSVDLQDVPSVDATGLIVSAPEADYVLLDHVYVALWSHHLEVLPQPRSEELAQPGYATKRLETIQTEKVALVVRVEIDGRATAGVVIRDRQYVLAPAHVVLRPGREATIVFPDGRRAQATTAGIDRATNIGLLKVAESSGSYVGDIADWNQWVVGKFFATVELVDDGSGGFKSVVSPARVVWWDKTSVWCDVEGRDALLGGVLFNWDGAPVGLRVATSPHGGAIYTAGDPMRGHWDRLVRGEALGEWFPGAGPTLGVSFEAEGSKCVVAAVPAGSPAAALQPGDVVETIDGAPVERPYEIDRVLGAKDPGDEVRLGVRRAGRPREAVVRLAPRP